VPAFARKVEVGRARVERQTEGVRRGHCPATASRP
jgi:hypothetical protein